MSQNIVLKKGLNIPISGEAELRVSKAIAPGITAVRPTDFKGLLPRLLVKEGDSVLCGSPVIADKKNPDILLTSPVSGTVKALVRGEKRKLLAVLIESDGAQKCVDFGVKDPSAMDAGQVKAALLESGLWLWIIQRPYGIIADPSVRPSGIFVSAFDSAPLAADADFCFADEIKNIQAGINAVAKLTDGEVHVSYNADGDPASALRQETHRRARTFLQGEAPCGKCGSADQPHQAHLQGRHGMDSIPARARRNRKAVHQGTL